jgi:basic membrane protein A
MKRLDNSVVGVTEMELNGEFPGGEVYVATLENGGVGLAPFHDFEDQIPDELKAEIDAIIEAIKSGELSTGWQ